MPPKDMPKKDSFGPTFGLSQKIGQRDINYDNHLWSIFILDHGRGVVRAATFTNLETF